MKQNEFGCNPYLAYCEAEARVGYFNTLRYAVIVPLLHSNTVKFVGLTDPENYLAFRTIGEKFIGLDNKGYLNIWSMISGKYLTSNKIKEDWIIDYELHYPDED